MFVSSMAFSTHETKIYFSHSEWLVRIDIALRVVMSLARGEGRAMMRGVRGFELLVSSVLCCQMAALLPVRMCAHRHFQYCSKSSAQLQ